MLLKTDRVRSRPLYQQITDGIKALVDQGVIGFDQVLPSTRNAKREKVANQKPNLKIGDK